MSTGLNPASTSLPAVSNGDALGELSLTRTVTNPIITIL